MRIKILGALLAPALLVAAAPASATAVTLTFDEGFFGCTTTDGGTVNKACTSQLDYIGVDAGSTPLLGVSSEVGGPATSLRFYDGGPSFTGVVAFPNDGSIFSDFVFTPTAGNEVSLRSWSYEAGSATAVEYFFEVRDPLNNLIASHHATTGGSFTANTAYYSGPVTFRFRNEGGGAVIDNIALDVRGTAVADVPEPATWAMMIVGFGAVGSALRRRPAVGPARA